MQQICDDLHAEYLDLRSLVADLGDDDWQLATPSPPWTILDQIAHLAYFDERAREAHVDPAAFAKGVADLVGDAADFEARLLDEGRRRSGAETLAWWDHAHVSMLDVYRSLDPRVRVLWYGPPMSARSKMTARLMETWAHGQDVADALRVRRQPTARLRHVCHIGVSARPYAYAANGMPNPPEEVHVALTGPSDELWTWGAAELPDRVTGSALGFALLVTQRRHRLDTDLTATEGVAEEWLSIAQAFAGPPGAGRRPGQFDAS